MNTVDELRDREVGFRVLTSAGAEIDTTIANGRLVFGIFASLAEFERDLIAGLMRYDMDDALRRKILGENALRFFGLQPRK